MAGNEHDDRQDGVWDACHACGHSDWFHPEMTGDDADPVRCAECNYTIGPWGELRDRLFTAGAMLSATLAKKR